MPVEELKIESKDQAGIRGFHTLSLCDARGRRAQDVIKDIENLIAQQHRLMYGSRKDIARAILSDDEAAVRELHKRRALLKNSGARMFEQMNDALRDVALDSEVSVTNIVPTAGRSVIAAWIIGDNTYSADDGANYGAVGTSNTTPANGDTILGAELVRKARSFESRSSNVATLSVFFNQSEANGTIEEGAWFIAASSTPDSGQILMHFLSGTTVKSSAKTLTMQSTGTIL